MTTAGSFRVFVLLLVLPFIAAGCTSIMPAIKVQEVKAPEKTLSLKVSAGEQVNPDISGRPSPTVVRIYQLKNDDKFKESDFFVLYDNDKAVLSSDVVASEEVVLKPNSDFSKTLLLHSDTRFIAILAAFQSVDNSVTKKSIELGPLYDSVHFRLEENRVVLAQ